MSKVYVTKVDDTYRVAGTRISLESLVYLYRQGISPEGMVESYPRLRWSKCMAHSPIIWPIRKRLTNTWRRRTQSPRSNIKNHGETTQN
jgi:Protein of unknown function (DUF433)